MIQEADKQKIEIENWPPRKWADGTGDKHEFLKLSYVLSESNRFVFIHVPKTAGMSIHRGVIDEEVPDAVTCPNLPEPIYSDCWSEYFKFAIVRNPWDRMVSCWRYNPSNAIPPGTSFTDFILDHAWDEAGDPVNKHWLEQSIFLGDDIRSWTDYIGRFEQLHEAWDVIRPRIGLPSTDLPHQNKSSRSAVKNVSSLFSRLKGLQVPSRTHRDYYTAQTRRIVATKFERDIDLFGYRF